jgi:hypothetical protein
MPRSLAVRPPTRRELRRLHAHLEGELPRPQRRRAEAIVLHAAGLAVPDIAEALGAHPHTIYADLHAFAAHGGGCLAALRRGGAPARLTAAQRAAILALADRPPTEVGLPDAR